LGRFRHLNTKKKRATARAFKKRSWKGRKKIFLREQEQKKGEYTDLGGKKRLYIRLFARGREDRKKRQKSAKKNSYKKEDGSNEYSPETGTGWG